MEVKGKSESEIVMISSCCHVALMVNIWKNVMSLLNQHLKYLSLFQRCACISLYPCRRKTTFSRLQLKLIGLKRLLQKGLKKQPESGRCAGSSSGPDGEGGSPRARWGLRCLAAGGAGLCTREGGVLPLLLLCNSPLGRPLGQGAKAGEPAHAFAEKPSSTRGGSRGRGVAWSEEAPR